MTLYGTKEKFGMMKANGESAELEFPVIRDGRLYQLYFLDHSEDLNGKNIK